jgi:hypothetical protein
MNHNMRYVVNVLGIVVDALVKYNAMCNGYIVFCFNTNDIYHGSGFESIQEMSYCPSVGYN